MEVAETGVSMPLIIHDLQDSQMFSLAQAAGRAGIPVYGTSWPMEPWVRKSRYVNDAVELRCLSEVTSGMYAYELKQWGREGVWLPCVDDVAHFTSRYQELLRSIGWRFVIADLETMERVTDTSRLPQGAGLAVAPMQIISSRELSEQAEAHSYPLMIKSQRDAYCVVHDADELRGFVSPFLPQHAEAPHRVQQFIEGDVSRMASAILLFDDEGRAVRGFTGRRQQVAATRFGPFGETVAARAEWIPELYEGARDLLRAVGWKGFAEVECKQDEQGMWHVMEINPRLSGWSVLAEADGAGFLAAYHRICSEGARLDDALLQGSRASYLRLTGTCYHHPCWDADPGDGGGIRQKGICFIRTLLKWWREHPYLQAGAWDQRDLAASLSILWRSIVRVHKQMRTSSR